VDSIPDLDRIDKFACNFHDSITQKIGFDTLIYYEFYRESEKLNIEYLTQDPKSLIDNIHSNNPDLYAVYDHKLLNCKLYRQLYEFSPNSKFSVLECDFCE